MSAWSQAVWLLNKIKAEIGSNTSDIIDAIDNLQIMNSYLSLENNEPLNPVEDSIWFIEEEDENN